MWSLHVLFLFMWFPLQVLQLPPTIRDMHLGLGLLVIPVKKRGEGSSSSWNTGSDVTHPGDCSHSVYNQAALIIS